MILPAPDFKPPQRRSPRAGKTVSVIIFPIEGNKSPTALLIAGSIGPNIAKPAPIDAIVPILLNIPSATLPSNPLELRSPSFFSSFLPIPSLLKILLKNPSCFLSLLDSSRLRSDLDSLSSSLTLPSEAI